MKATEAETLKRLISNWRSEAKDLHESEPPADGHVPSCVSEAITLEQCALELEERLERICRPSEIRKPENEYIPIRIQNGEVLWDRPIGQLVGFQVELTDCKKQAASRGSSDGSMKGSGSSGSMKGSGSSSEGNSRRILRP